MVRGSIRPQKDVLAVAMESRSLTTSQGDLAEMQPDPFSKGVSKLGVRIPTESLDSWDEMPVTPLTRCSTVEIPIPKKNGSFRLRPCLRNIKGKRDDESELQPLLVNERTFCPPVGTET
jgi:hypothetical protein